MGMETVPDDFYDENLILHKLTDRFIAHNKVPERLNIAVSSDSIDSDLRKMEFVALSEYKERPTYGKLSELGITTIAIGVY
jgi:hypothetical protein